MATPNSYTFTFTEDSLNIRAFGVSPYTTNGPVSPVNPSAIVLDSSAVSASTSLLLVGKGMPDYGDIVQQNMLHMLAHFAGNKEPIFPIAGQMWFNTNILSMTVFDPFVHEIIQTTVTPTQTIKIAGDHVARFNAVGTGFQFRVRKPDNTEVTLSMTGLATLSGPDTVIPVNNAALVTPLNNNTVGSWIPLVQTNATAAMLADLSMGGYKIVDLGDPTAAQDAVTLQYGIDNYAKLTGASTINGWLYRDLGLGNQIPSSVASNEFVTKQLVEDYALTLETTTYTDYDAETRKIINLANPTANQDAATKWYVDNFGGGSGATTMGGLTNVNSAADSPTLNDILVWDGVQWDNQPIGTATGALPISGGTMTGVINMDGYGIINVPTPSLPLDAVNKGYVDSLTRVTGVSLTGTITGGLTLDVTTEAGPQPPQNIAALDLNTSNVEHANLPNYNYGIVGDFIEKLFYQDGGYPTINVSSLLQRLSEFLYERNEPLYRILVTPGNGDTAIFAPTLAYKVGWNHLAVFKNGVKQYASERGYAEIENTVPFTGGEDGIYLSVPTGATNDATQYSINVSVDGGVNQNLVFAGSSIQTFADLRDQINLQLTGGIAGFYDGRLTIFSDSSGNGSSITLSAGSTGLNLLPNLDGTLAIGLNPSITVNKDFYEVGAWGEESNTIGFYAAQAGTEDYELLVVNNGVLGY